MTPLDTLLIVADALETASFLTTKSPTEGLLIDGIDGDGWGFNLDLDARSLRVTRPDHTPLRFPDILPEHFVSLADLVGLLSIIKTKVLPRVRARTHEPRVPKGGTTTDAPNLTRLLTETFNETEPEYLHIHDKHRQWSIRRDRYANTMTIFAMQGEWNVLVPWPMSSTVILSPSASQRASNGPRLNVGTSLIRHLEHLAELGLDSLNR
jgi:hypothetical protein